jgi:Zn finger protein HypA/HybF involved in hydrogenase expression
MRTQSYAKRNDPEIEEELRIKKGKVDCLCPKCNKVHKMNFMWTGKGMPRKFCPECRNTYSD